MINDLEIYDSHVSCGIRELSGVASSDLHAFKCIVAQKTAARGDWSYFDKNYTYIFSDNKQGNGEKLAALIKRSAIGVIHASTWRVNPNSGNWIKVWTWRYNGRVPSKWKKIEWNEESSNCDDWRTW